MKKIIIAFAIASLLGALLLHFIGMESGYVLIVFQQVSIEMSLWMAALLLLFGFVVFWLILKFIYGFGFWFFARGVHKQQYSTAQGLKAFIEGRWQRAQAQLLKSAEYAQEPLVNYVVAARAANELGREKEVESLLLQAEEIGPNTNLAVGLARAEIQIEKCQWEQALATLARLRKDSPENTNILLQFKVVYSALHDWQNLKQLIPDLRKSRSLPKETLDGLEVECNKFLLAEALSSAEARENPLQKLNDVWNSLPKNAKKSRTMILLYAKNLLACGEESQAEQVLRNALKKYWSDDLVELYGQVKGEDLNKQLVTTEGWLKERPNNAILLLALGRICLRTQSWEKAKQYLEACLLQGDNVIAGLELSRLLLAMEEYEKGKILLNKNLQKEILPELPLPK